VSNSWRRPPARNIARRRSPRLGDSAPVTATGVRHGELPPSTCLYLACPTRRRQTCVCSCIAEQSDSRRHIAPMILVHGARLPFQFAYRVGGASRTQGIDGEGLQPIPSAIKSPPASPADRYRLGRANYSVHARVEQSPVS